MSQRFNCRILLLFALAAVVYSQDSPPDKSASRVAQPVKFPASIKLPKTNGIIGTLMKSLWPLTQVYLQLLESYLKNMYGQSLPCRLESITPLKAECTKLKQS